MNADVDVLRVENLDLVAVRVRVFDHDDGVSPGREHRAGMDARRAERFDP